MKIILSQKLMLLSVLQYIYGYSETYLQVDWMEGEK